MKTTDQPFDLALDELLTEQELSDRGLSKKTRERGKVAPGDWSRLSMQPDPWASRRKAGFSGGYLSRLRRGDDFPSPRTIEIIASALQVDPAYFAEYRLDVARERLNWRAPDRAARHQRLALALRELREEARSR